MAFPGKNFAEVPARDCNLTIFVITTDSGAPLLAAFGRSGDFRQTEVERRFSQGGDFGNQRRGGAALDGRVELSFVPSSHRRSAISTNERRLISN